MPNKSNGYMQALDQWTQETILDPLYQAWREVESAPEEAKADLQDDLTELVAEVKKAIREKVLESYRNGPGSRAAGPCLSIARMRSRTRRL